MIRWLKALFAWRDQFVSGVVDVPRERITGERRVRRWSSGYSPVDRHRLKRETNGETI